MAGYDLSNVSTIISGAERVLPETIKRFTERFKRFNLRESVIRPTYGLAESTLYVATTTENQPPGIVDFETDKLSEGQADGAQRNRHGTGQLFRAGCTHRADRRSRHADRVSAGTTGEIWVHGDNVGLGYWENPEETERTFGGMLVDPSAGTPEGPWLRTGDLGFLSDGELFIVGRIKDLLIVYGRNHAPEDIEATIQGITRGRCAAIAVPRDGMEQLVAVIEVKTGGDSDEDAMHKFALVKRQLTAAISNAHALGVADLVLVPPGSIPITTSGKVRRSTCVEQYQRNEFARVDAEPSAPALG